MPSWLRFTLYGIYIATFQQYEIAKTIQFILQTDVLLQPKDMKTVTTLLPLTIVEENLSQSPSQSSSLLFHDMSGTISIVYNCSLTETSKVFVKVVI